MNVCEFSYSAINSLYQKYVSSVDFSEGGSCDITDIQNPCNYSLQGFSVNQVDFLSSVYFDLVCFIKDRLICCRDSLPCYKSIFA